MFTVTYIVNYMLQYRIIAICIYGRRASLPGARARRRGAAVPAAKGGPSLTGRAAAEQKHI